MKNKEEIIARNFLRNERYYDVISHEPDGNVPPDLLVRCNDQIAVEVRRLNENDTRDNQNPIGLDRDKRILDGHLIKICSDIKKVQTRGYYLSVDIIERKGRLVGTKINYNEISRKIIVEAYNSNVPDGHCMKFTDFEITWFRTSSGPEDLVAVEPGFFLDNDSGGFIAEVYKKNIQAIINEKTQKVTRNSINTYSTWWLVLIDAIFPSSEYLYKGTMSLDLKKFSRVVIVNNLGLVLTEFPKISVLPVYQYEWRPAVSLDTERVGMLR